MSIQRVDTKEYRNWSGEIQFRPHSVLLPQTEEEVSEILLKAKKHGKTVRVIGTGHSFTPLVATSEILVSLDRMQGLIENNAENVTVWAGTKLKFLGELLNGIGLGMENLGDIDAQSIGGTISTGTHGTGTRFGIIATQVRELTLVIASGERVVCSNENNPSLFKAALTSLGSIGVITRVKIKTVPAFKLKFIQGKEGLKSCLDQTPKYNEENRNFEFYYFPHTDVAQTKFVNLTHEKPDLHSVKKYLNEVVLENTLFKVVSEVSRVIPSSTISVAKLCGWGVSPLTKKDWSHKIFAVPRLVKFNEMEYSIPVERMKDVVLEIAETVKREQHRVHFPIECRFVKGDDLWLSPAYGRDSAYIAAHMYKGMDYHRYFNALESIYKNNQGRPHWGKMHTRDARDFAQLYPMWNDFLKLRSEFDPTGIFLTPYMKKIFGLI